jgi:hypothetical protein
MLMKRIIFNFTIIIENTAQTDSLFRKTAIIFADTERMDARKVVLRRKTSNRRVEIQTTIVKMY